MLCKIVFCMKCCLLGLRFLMVIFEYYYLVRNFLMYFRIDRKKDWFCFVFLIDLMCYDMFVVIFFVKCRLYY